MIKKSNDYKKTDIYLNIVNNKINSNEINKIYNCDFIEKLKLSTSKIVDLTILDPPYYQVVNEKWDNDWKSQDEYLQWFEEVIKEVSRVSKNNGALYLFGYWKTLYKQIPILEKYGFIFKQSITNIYKSVRNNICLYYTGYYLKKNGLSVYRASVAVALFYAYYI